MTKLNFPPNHSAEELPDRSLSKLKILWLFPKYYWERKASPVRRHSLLAIGRHPEVHLHISGPGWSDYDTAATVEENRLRLLPDSDLVGWYKPLGESNAAVRPEDQIVLKDPQGVRVPRCLRFNEAWWPDDQALNEVRSTGTSLVICHHQEDLHRFESQIGIFPFHIPHGAERSIFEPVARPQSERDIPVLLNGTLALHHDLYPLRKRIYALINAGEILGTIRKGPPPFLSSLKECDRQVSEYAELLGRTQILMTDGTRHGYPLAKYSEAAMCGALVIGTAPLLPPPNFSDLFVEIAPGASDSEIVECVRYWSSNHDARAERAELGRQVALEHFTQERYAADFVKTVHYFLKNTAL